MRCDKSFSKNSGSVAGKKYFNYPDKYAGFIKPSRIVGVDFPEENFDLNEEL